MKSFNFVNMDFFNFKSFKGDHVFVFPPYHGFYNIHGVNKIDTEIQSNGSGKSTIWDALCWVLYGVSASGSKATELLNTDLDIKKDGYFVRLNFIDEVGDSYSLYRGWNPNKLSLSTGSYEREVTNEWIVDYFNMTKYQFLHSILIGQSSSFFFDLSSSDKVNLFENIIDRLDQWDVFSERSSVEYSECMEEIARLNSLILTHEGSLHGLFSEEDINKMEIEWRSTQSKKLKDYEDKINAFLIKIEELNNKISKMENHKDDSLEKSLEELREKEKNLIIIISDLKHRIKNTRTSIENLKIKKTFYADNKKCPMCDQDLSKEFTSLMYEDFDAKMFELEIYNKNEEKNILNKAVEMDAILAEIDWHREAIQINNEVLEEIRLLEIQKQTSNININSIKETIQALLKEKNPYEDMREKTNEKREYYTKSIESYKEKIKRLVVIGDALKFWKSHFKKIRFFVIQSIADYLNVSINNELPLLGLHGWKVLISTEKILKSGETIPSISVSIQSPKIKRNLSWESWSGGEKQRLRLASAIGLSTMIQHMKGVRFDSEIWDEPLTGVVDQGVDGFLNLLRDRSSLLKKKIFFIDHRSVKDFGGFSGQYDIVKTEESSEVYLSYIKGE